MAMKRVLINSLGWTDSEKSGFKIYLSDLAAEYECHIEVLEGVDSNMDISVETDDERIVYMILEAGLCP